MRAFPQRLLAFGFALVAGSAFAGPIAPQSYDMNNGDGEASGGNFNYWDLNYTGSGSTSTDGAPLSGGLGDLSDGVTTTANWDEIENDPGTGPYVGWLNTDPVEIVFHFAGVSAIDRIAIHADDADGRGGVALPSQVEINGNVFIIGDIPGDDPRVLEFDNLGLNTDTVTLRISEGQGAWVFVSEVSFFSNAAPLPSTALLLLAGLPLLRRRQGE